MTFKDHLVQHPCRGQGRLSLGQDAQSSMTFQWWGGR